MYISIETNEASENDRRILRAIADALVTTEPKSGADVVKEDRKQEQAKKTAPATKKTAASKAEPAAEPESSEDSTSLLDDAQEKATELVQSGEIPRVKRALKAVGVKKVSELTDDVAEAFLAALDEDE